MIAGVLLAGGRSSRFGREKAVEPLGDGLVLMDVGVRTLQGACDVVAVAAREGSGAAGHAAKLGLPVLPDPYGVAAGPLAGVLAGITWARNQGATTLVTCPCDTLGVSEAALAALATHQCAYASTADGPQFLVSAWPVNAAAPLLEEAARQDRHPSVRSLLETLGAKPEPMDGLRNVNTPADLTRLSKENGAGEAIRTPDPHLGKVMLYP